MIKKKTLTPLVLAGIFFLMLGLPFASVPLYDLFCRVTGFGGTTQVSKEAPKVVLDKVINVRLDTNVNGNLSWNFKAEKNLLDVELKGYDHYIFINERNKAQVVSKQGGWVTEHIRTAILKFNFEIDKTESMLVKDFEKKYLSEYEKTFSKDS